MTITETIAEIMKTEKSYEQAYTKLAGWLMKKYPHVYTDWCCCYGEKDKTTVIKDELVECEER